MSKIVLCIYFLKSLFSRRKCNAKCECRKFLILYINDGKYNVNDECYRCFISQLLLANTM